MFSALPPTYSSSGPLEEDIQDNGDICLLVDHHLQDVAQEEMVVLVINTLAASDGTAPPQFRDDLGPPPAAGDADGDAEDSPASPDPYGDEGTSDAESSSSQDSMASTIPFSPGRHEVDPFWWEDSGMSEADDDNNEDEGRLVIDENSPRSPSP